MITVGEKTLPWREGMTVSDLLRLMDQSHPYAVIRINEEYISRPNFDKTLIPDNARIYLIPMIAGG
jgi:thiamine biosynthesis protein ThiS